MMRRRVAALLALATFACGVLADEAQIRKTLAERLPRLPKVDEVTKSPIPGLYEVRMGTDIVYTDEQANFVVTGDLIETKTQANLTQARIDKLTAIDFAKLPMKDAITIRQGNGARKMAVFVDPNCGYCKRFERDLAAIKDVTIHTFLYPILGPESIARSRAIWCAKEPSKAWRDWMLAGTEPPAAADKCDSSVLERNTELGRKHRVQGTPAAVFEDGTRLPGAVPGERIERQLAASAKKG